MLRLSNNSWLHCHLIGFGIITLGLFSFEPFWYANDDALMAMISSGTGIVSHPSKYLVFPNILFGMMLKQLNLWTTELPWYGWLLVFTQGLAFSSLIYAIVHVCGWSKQIFLVIAVIITTLFCLLIRLSYTTTAFIAGMAAFCCIFSTILTGQYRHPLLFIHTIGLFLICVLLRPEVALLLWGLSLVPILILLWNKQNITANLKPVLLILSLFFISIVICHRINSNVYSKSSNWEQTLRWVGAAQKIIDFRKVPYNEKSQPFYQSLGWKQIDYLMFIDFFAFGNKFKADKLESIVASSPTATLWDRLSKLPSRLKARIYEMAQYRETHFLIAWIFLPLVILGFQRMGTIQYFLIVGYFLFVMGFLIFWKRLPWNIYFPVLAFLPLLSPYFLHNKKPKSHSIFYTFRRTSIYVLVVAFCLVRLQAYYGLNKSNLSEYQKLKEDVKALKATEDQLYVIWGHWLSVEGVPALSTYKETFGNMKLLSTGWAMHTPLALERLAEFQEYDPYLALINNKKVFLISSQERNEVLLGPFYRLSLNTEVTFSPTAEFSSFQVFKVAPKKSKSQKPNII